MHLIHYLAWFWHFGVLLYSMRLIKCRKLWLLLSLHTFSLLHHLYFACSWCVPPETFPGFPTRFSPNSKPEFLPRGAGLSWPSQLPLNVAQQFISSSETAKKHSASAEAATAQVLRSKVGPTPPEGFSLCFGKQLECLEIYCWLPYLCSVILHVSDSTRSLTAASGILQSLTFTRQQFTVVELTTYL